MRDFVDTEFTPAQLQLWERFEDMVDKPLSRPERRAAAQCPLSTPDGNQYFIAALSFAGALDSYVFTIRSHGTGFTATVLS